MDCPDESIEVSARGRCVGVEPEDDPRDHFHAVAIEGFDPFEDRHHRLWILCHRFERGQLRCLDPAEHGEKCGLPHQRQDLRPLGDVERCLAGELNAIASALLPVDQMRQELARSACRLPMKLSSTK